MKAGAALFAAAVATLAPPATAQLADTAWIAPGGDAAAVLTQAPAECVRPPADADAAYLVEVGRAAFRSPLLLGGAAARRGLSCNACHRSGRDNPHFFVDGLSSAPGSADVTSSVFSRVREDGVFNPVVIPDLALLAEKRDAEAAHGLRRFIAAAVTEEFAGAPPPDAVLQGLVAYVASFDARACPEGPVPEMPARDMDAAARALAAAAGALARGDAATADVLILAAQGELGRVHARFAPLPKDQKKIETLARAIGMMRVRTVSEAEIDARRIEIARLAAALETQKARSLYDPETVAAAIKRPP